MTRRSEEKKRKHHAARGGRDKTEEDRDNVKLEREEDREEPVIATAMVTTTGGGSPTAMAAELFNVEVGEQEGEKKTEEEEEEEEERERKKQEREQVDMVDAEKLSDERALTMATERSEELEDGEIDPEPGDGDGASYSDADRPTIADDEVGGDVARSEETSGSKRSRQDDRNSKQRSDALLAGSSKKLKKQRQLVLAGKGTKNDYFDVYGPNARAEVSLLATQVPTSDLRLQDISQLILWVLGDAPNPKWVFVKNKPLISKVVMLLLSGLDATLFNARPDLFPGLSRCCGKPCNVTAISPVVDSLGTASTLLSCPSNSKTPAKRKGTAAFLEQIREKKPSLPDTESRAEVLKRLRLMTSDDSTVDSIADNGSREEEDKSWQRSNGATKTKFSSTPPASYYAMSLKDMEDRGYPTAQHQEDGALIPPEGFLLTRPAERGKAFRDMVAVDCEMCQTQEGLQVTRISIVDTNGKVLLDRLVKPETPITDYLTQYSGITPEMMNDVTTTLSDVQEDFLKLVTADTLLVGHSLDSDLKSLRIVHHRVLDTAFIYPHPRGPPFRPALRVLADMFLKRKIQDCRKRGHDSVEDARAAMDLAKLKVRHGPAFGEPSLKFRDSLVAQLGELGHACSLVDKAKALQRLVKGTASAIQCLTDKDVLCKASREVQSEKVSFVWARFSDLASFYEQRSRSLEAVATQAAELAAMMTCTSLSVNVQRTAKKDDKEETLESESCGMKKPNREGQPAEVRSMNGATVGCQSASPEPRPLAARQPWMEPKVPHELEEQLRIVDSRIASLHEALPPNTLFIVATGHGDTAIVRRLQELRWKRLQGAGPDTKQWDEGNDKILKHFQSRAKTGLGFFTVKA